MQAAVNVLEVNAVSASVWMKRTGCIHPSNSDCVSHVCSAARIEVVLLVLGSPIQPVSLPGVVTIKR